MNWLDVLIGLEGRITRQPFWIVLLALLVIEVAAHYLMGERSGSTVSLILAYPQFAVFAKRGHDRNVPSWVAGLFTLGGVVLDVLTLADMSGPTEKPTTIFLVIAIPVGILGLILLADFGFRRGTVGPNRYGPDPLQR